MIYGKKQKIQQEEMKNKEPRNSASQKRKDTENAERAREAKQELANIKRIHTVEHGERKATRGSAQGSPTTRNFKEHCEEGKGEREGGRTQGSPTTSKFKN